ncbi:LysM peptidoglycan-binding domain-containing protein [Deinococcus sp. 6YEL10]|uniref:LysM peptidoglycan-binding domain-containing protein n=1 Tax=Deinococcus sp. 6YEL10 TaxID=2745870 RepID=UPI001E365754|nr:LysM peptidoglycan-binding domain-containing protein [Deinococcus sp. 6YEL10]MCD0162520.1 LysM peptidoglycan-binding domain-containing protein [Deinococcus sp. 6YEL10]
MWPFGKSTADRVKDAINENPVLAPLGLNVSESRGTVTVTGEVPRQPVVGLISVVVEGINGVKNVDTSGVTVLRQAAAPVQPAPDAPAATVTTPDLSPADEKMDAEVKEMEDSSRVAKAVLKALRGNVELADDPIDVLQSGKSVILRGVVDNDHEKRLAEKLAREVQGVASVDVSGLRVAAGAKELAKEKDQDTGDTVYTVKAGDTLGAIAQKYYGNAAEYKKIAHFNNISNPDLIKVGQKIRIPG